jgi:hypothetical protein
LKQWINSPREVFQLSTVTTSVRRVSVALAPPETSQLLPGAPRKLSKAEIASFPPSRHRVVAFSCCCRRMPSVTGSACFPSISSRKQRRPEQDVETPLMGVKEETATLDMLDGDSDAS